MKLKKRKLFKQDFNKITSFYKNNKVTIVKKILFACLLFFIGLAFVGTQLFYPFHFLISLFFFFLSGKLILNGLFLSRKNFNKSKFLPRAFKALKKRKYFFIIAIVLGFLLSSYLTISPYDYNPYKDLNDKDLNVLIEQDLIKSSILIDNLELTGGKLLSSDLLKSEELSLSERAELLELWNNFLMAVSLSEELTEIHKYFNKLPSLKNSKEKTKAFMISYSLYIKKYEIFHKLIVEINGNDFVKKVLNEEIGGFGKETFSNTISLFYERETLLRRNLGRGYSMFITMFKIDKKFDENYKTLKHSSDKSHNYLIKNFDKTILEGVVAEKDKLENRLFDTWFPIQKNTANLMGNLHLSRRDEKFITIAQIGEMKKEMKPGDIMIQRRNWYASNVGIPGFWPHAALYTGSLSDMNSYFDEVFPYDDFSNLTSLIKERYSNVYTDLNKKDKQDFEKSVIEGKSPGIILLSLETSAKADYVAVLRPNIPKLDKLKAILRAFEHHGKPYDYNFDFETKDELVCSELVYDAYLPAENKKGINFKLNTINGRKIVSPTDFAKKYYNEYENGDSELEFIYFIDGNEKLGKAFVKGEAEFLTTWTRPKYDWSQE